MKIKTKRVFQLLVAINAIISSTITYLIISRILYNKDFFSFSVFIILLYGTLWFYSLYKIYNFSKGGVNLYVILVGLGFIFNILSNFKDFSQLFYILTLTEHLVIGSIITFALFSKIKFSFK